MDQVARGPASARRKATRVGAIAADRPSARESTVQALQALRELQRRAVEAGISEEDVRREVEAFRAGR